MPPSSPLPARGQAELSLEFAPGHTQGQTRKGLRNQEEAAQKCFLVPRGKGSWPCTWVALCHSPLLPQKGGCPHLSPASHPRLRLSLAHTRSSRDSHKARFY